MTLTTPTKGQVFDYKDGSDALQGYISAPTTNGKKPAILIIHQWSGLTDYEKMRADMMADLGYVGFAVDIYGRDTRPTKQSENGQYAGKYKGNRALYRQRIQAALDAIKKREDVDSSKIAVIGYCFGGTGALEAARMGADVKGVVSFHGSLDTPTPEDAKSIKGKVMVCNGADDPSVPPKQQEDFAKEMRDANIDWQLINYGGAVHAFTQPGAGNDNSRGAAYNEKADKRSWEHMVDFFREIFSK
ncbi:MAG: dienelactone hydrolase family protein [Armatimonadetes bacterium]|nr:dienelactone hydrolase family protein [Armatimonadota bacterium]